ncbi:hypothetical protein [Micromonospora sp. LH3U1]|uniref:hypothetical protein n=1 Tax=Micromonospora sp. LH3U1 TaxID=3018339 RepID=UPI002349D51C|nr:hypothetical protein [Micromonospora sp. LH3U1]WCN83831.1 hypothetical protein PCA76_12670 [Micromonospora sp. LH3U1]
MPDDFGPFSVNPDHLTGLGGALFQELVSRLLAAEVAAAGLSQVTLRTSHDTNKKDGGVDAETTIVAATDWIPVGDTAWQFKAGTLGPEGCADELDGAAFARKILEKGGTYRLVLGKRHEAQEIADREARLRERAEALGFDVSGERFKIIEGNQLARWIERFPALAVSRVVGNAGPFAIDFESWILKDKHRYRWVPSVARDELRDTILQFLEQSSELSRRIEGASGLGKSRGAMEALRGSRFEPLVIYVGDATEIGTSAINHFARQNRSAVLVVDECDRQRHKMLAEQLESGSPVRLITIGQADASWSQTQPLSLSKLPDDVIDKALTQSFPTLWPEARRLVIDNCAGNIGWALYLAKVILKDPKASAADLIDASELGAFILSMVASDGDFLAVSVLALLSRIGVDGDKAAELELLAAGLDLPLEDLQAALRRLNDQGLVTKHGRYRAVSPHPLAVLLASRAWDALGEKIITQLLPALDGAMAERLFLRAAQIGSSGPAAVALNKILNVDGPFGSLASIAEEANSRLLIQLAIIAPAQVASHLAALIDAASDDEIRSMTGIRRNLVWTLEKLVWHSVTFEIAADMLLRLALIETETFSNNATGTWVGLFGTMLPATAARPDTRMAYLERAAADSSPAVRKLTVSAADHALDAHGGMVMVSGELQGGVVVEPRGTPADLSEAWDYVKSAIALLSAYANDDLEPEIRTAATKALVDAIHPFLEGDAVRDTLFDALASLPPEGRRRAWTAINHLAALFDRVDSPEFAQVVDTKHDTTARRAGLDILIARMPKPDAQEELSVLADARRWEWEDGELQRKIVATAQSLPADEATSSLLTLAQAVPPPEASYEIGAVLYAIASCEETAEKLSLLADASNIASLTGYLQASVNDGKVDAFDAFIDGPVGRGLKAVTRLSLTVRGPRSEVGWDRAVELQAALPVSQGAPRIFGWHTGVEPERILALIKSWIPRITTQQDYNAAVDVTAMMLFQKPELEAAIEEDVAELVSMRSQFGELGQQGYDWVQLAKRRLRTDPQGLLEALLAQVDAGSMMTFDGSEELRLLREAIAAAGPDSLGLVLGKIEGGSWRLQMDFRGWLTNAYAADDLIQWVGEDVECARLVASMSGIGDGGPNEVVQYLLTNFGTDDQLASALYGTFITGSWSGNESVRLNGQIAQLQGWVKDRSVSSGVKSWARTVIGYLNNRLEKVLVEEAEENR